jgi:hypothetical protein
MGEAVLAGVLVDWTAMTQIVGVPRDVPAVRYTVPLPSFPQPVAHRVADGMELYRLSDLLEFKRKRDTARAVSEIDAAASLEG